MKRICAELIIVLVLLLFVAFAAYRFGESRYKESMKPKRFTVIAAKSTQDFTDLDEIRVALTDGRIISIDLLPSDWGAIRIHMNYLLNPSNQTHSIVVRPTAANSVLVEAESQKIIDPAALKRLEKTSQPSP